RYVNAANSHLVPELSAMAYAGRHSTFSQKAICRERYCTFGKFRRAAPKGVRGFGGFPSLQAGAEASCVSLLEPVLARDHGGTHRSETFCVAGRVTVDRSWLIAGKRRLFFCRRSMRDRCTASCCCRARPHRGLQ